MQQLRAVTAAELTGELLHIRGQSKPLTSLDHQIFHFLMTGPRSLQIACTDTHNQTILHSKNFSAVLAGRLW